MLNTTEGVRRGIVGADVGTACVYEDMEGPMRLPRWKAGVASLGPSVLGEGGCVSELESSLGQGVVSWGDR